MSTHRHARFVGFLILGALGAASADTITLRVDKPAVTHGDPVIFHYTRPGPADPRAEARHIELDARHLDGAWRSPPILVGTSGSFTIDTKGWLFAGPPYRGASGIKRHSDPNFRIYVKRPISPAPNGLLHLDRATFMVGEAIPATVSAAIDQFVAPFTQPETADVATLALLRLPREVPGGAWIPPNIPALSSQPVRRGAGTYDLASPWRDPAPSGHHGAQKNGLLPGHYLAQLRVGDIVIDETPIEIRVPAPGDLAIIDLLPRPAPDEATPVYNQLPNLGLLTDGIPPELLRHGMLRVFRVGQNGNLRLVAQQRVDCGEGRDPDAPCAPVNVQGGSTWRMFHEFNGVPMFGYTGGQPLEPGAYEARYYYRHDRPGFDYDQWEFVLDTRRFVLSERAIAQRPHGGRDTHWERTAAPLSPQSLTLVPERTSVLRMGEFMRVDIADGPEAPRGGPSPWAALREQVWASLHRLGGDTLGCARYEEQIVGAPVTLKTPDTAPAPMPSGAQPGNFKPMVLPRIAVPSLPSFAPPALPSLPPNSSPRGDAPADPSVAGTSNASQPYLGKSGERTLALRMPRLPGRYELRLYRGAGPGSGETARFADGELLASTRFEVQASPLPGAIDYPEPRPDARRPIGLKVVTPIDEAILPGYQLAIVAARETVPGGARTLPAWRSAPVALGSGIRAFDAATTYLPNQEPRSQAGHAQAHLISNGIVLASSRPVRYVDPDNDLPWPDDFEPTPIASYDDLIVPVDAWLLPPGSCGDADVPDHRLRLVNWIPAEPTERTEYDGTEYALITGEGDRYEVLERVYFGHPFYIEAVFDTAPDAARYVGRAGDATRVEFERSDDPRIYRSTRMFVVTEDGLRKAP